MIHTCKRCHSVNPREAVYCHHDGVVLNAHVGDDVPADGSAINVGAKPFTVPLVFPSGRKCANFLQLAHACQEEATAALDMLRRGHLEAFLAGQGRADLAGAARAAARAADRQRGLDDFLGRLPAPLSPPKLRVQPAALDLGAMRVGDDRRCELTLVNDGARLLYGSAASDAPWLSVGDGPASLNKVFQFTDRAVVPVRILGNRLRAYHKPQEAVIVIDSNGGAAAVAVRVQVSAQPFPEGILAGALSPRQLAEKAREAPKDAAPWIENGAVARWYKSNGWTYPVSGPTASGIAAVQQLFEALGLVQPPKVELSEDAIQLRGAPGQKIEYVLTAVTDENRAVVAHGGSDQPWLTVGPTVFRGRSAFLPLTVAAAPDRPGETLRATVSVSANGNQKFTVPVTLQLAGEPRAPERKPVPVAAPAVAPPAPIIAAPLPRAEVPGRASVFTILLPAVLLFVVAAGAVVRDYFAPGPVAPPPPQVVFDSAPRLEIRVHDEARNDELEKVWLTDGHPTMRFGVVMLRDGQPVGQGINIRRLTFDPWGRTNNTCLRFDNKDERLFGGVGGSWEERAAKNWKEQDQEHEGVRSVWSCDDFRIRVTQSVELVRGEQSHVLDTCRARYLLENHSAQPRTVGIRFLLDTFIGGNDNVPFTIPGASGLCDTDDDLPKQAKDKKIPDFLQALEKPDLAHPGTIAHLRLNVENLEPPDRVTLGAWPNERLRVLDRNAAGPSTLWDVPLLPMNSLGLKDSAVAIYWKEALLPAGGRREVGFEYGLWSLVSEGGRLAATVDGAFRPGGELTVIAYLNRSAGEKDDPAVTLKVPADFKIVEGAPTQHAPKLPKDAKSGNVPITWKVQAGPTGEYDLTIESSTGQSQTLHVEIRKPIF